MEEQTKKKNQTEELMEELAEKKRADKEAKEAVQEEVPEKEVKVMNSSIPFIAFIVVWIIFFLIFSLKEIITIVIAAILSILIFLLLSEKRKKQIKFNASRIIKKSFSQEVSINLEHFKDEVIDRAKKISDSEVKDILGSMAVTLEKMAEEIEKDPEDGNKVRKLANHYQDMILELIDKYCDFEAQKDIAVEGGNIETGMSGIKSKLKEVDQSLKKTLDDMFTEDTMVINADMSALDSLMNLKSENQ